jgi:hypothetical protein
MPFRAYLARSSSISEEVTLRWSSALMLGTLREANGAIVVEGNRYVSQYLALLRRFYLYLALLSYFRFDYLLVLVNF